LATFDPLKSIPNFLFTTRTTMEEVEAVDVLSTLYP